MRPIIDHLQIEKLAPIYEFAQFCKGNINHWLTVAQTRVSGKGPNARNLIQSLRYETRRFNHRLNIIIKSRAPGAELF